MTAAPVLQTAYHEAGHAVVASYLGHGIRSLTVIEDEDSRGAARGYPDMVTRADPDEWRLMWESDGRFRRRFEAHIMTLIAGGLAEEKYLGRELATGDERAGLGFQDIGRADGACMLVSGSDWWKIANWTEKVSRYEDEAVAYQNWLTVRANGVLADVLVWNQVRAVAEALAAEQRLSGRRYRELLDAGRDQALAHVRERIHVNRPRRLGV